MSERISISGTLGAASGDTDSLALDPAPTDSPVGRAGSFAVCTCDFPGCQNVAREYCKMHAMWLEMI